MSNKNTEGMIKYQKEKNRENIIKVNKAIASLKRSKKKITVVAVAQKAGVAVKTIYNNPELKERIDFVKTKNTVSELQEVNVKKKSSKDLKIEELREMIRNLKEENNKEKIKNHLLLGNLEKLTSENLELKTIINQYREGKVIKI